MSPKRFDVLVKPAKDLMEKKSLDYDKGIELHAYFPFGDSSYVQMLHMKTLRLVSLLSETDAPIFESKMDTVLDLLNYTVIYLDYLTAETKDEDL